MQIDIVKLQGWIGREQKDSEVLSTMLVRQFDATFDRTSGTKQEHEAPLLIHLCLAQPTAPMSELGRDGHPALGDFLPPVPLPRPLPPPLLHNYDHNASLLSASLPLGFLNSNFNPPLSRQPQLQ